MVITCPFDNPEKYPIINAPIMNNNPNHPFFRPLRKFFENGNPTVGEITYILIQTSFHQFPAVLASVCWLPDTKRILLFPAWGLGRLDKIDPKGNALLQGKTTDHITCELTDIVPTVNNGSIHFTFTDQKRTKWKGTYLTLRDKTSLHWGRMQIREPDILDLAGIATLEVNQNRYFTRKKIEEVLSKAIKNQHPILYLPGGGAWSSGRLLVEFLIIQDKLEDREYPRLGPCLAKTESLTKIPLDKGLSLLVRLQNDQTTPLRSFCWEHKRSQPSKR
ncbi:hypothetical protein KKF03_05330 [Patescibacteria group bacterium]|nr:hypothetical protein [Patescibacteria group bacterium]MBU1166378.1 hypothetical protein [Candidatus Micrarchaeota archaeon]